MLQIPSGPVSKTITKVAFHQLYYIKVCVRVDPSEMKNSRGAVNGNRLDFGLQHKNFKVFLYK